MDNNGTICNLCGKEALLIEKSYQGYVENSFYKIYFCSNCNVSFVPINEDVEIIYDLIYRYAEKVNGYNRYYRYLNTVKNEKDPLEYLASSEETYWVVKDALSKIEKEKKDIEIIEIGSGFGYLTYALNKDGYNTLGMDISQRAVEKAIQQFGSYYICADVNEYSKSTPKQYDVAILTEVIEHIEKPVEFLRSVSSMLKKEGKIVISTPNKTIFSDDIIWNTDSPPIHLWWFSKKSMLQIGGLLDMKVEFTDFTNYYKSREVFASLAPYKPKPHFNSKGILINPQDEIPIPYTNPIKAFFKKNKTLLYIVRKIKFGKYFYKFGKAGPFLGVIFEKNTIEANI